MGAGGSQPSEEALPEEHLDEVAHLLLHVPFFSHLSDTELRKVRRAPLPRHALCPAAFSLRSASPSPRSPVLCAQFAKRCRLRIVPKGATVLEQGESTRALFVVVRGAVAISQVSVSEARAAPAPARRALAPRASFPLRRPVYRRHSAL